MCLRVRSVCLSGDTHFQKAKILSKYIQRTTMKKKEKREKKKKKGKKKKGGGGLTVR